MKTLYVNMSIARQTKLEYIKKLFDLVDHIDSGDEHIIAMKYTLPNENQNVEEIILNQKYSIGLDCVFFEKNESYNINRFMFDQKKSSDSKWVRAKNFNEGIDNLWERMINDIVVVKHFIHNKGHYHAYVWEKKIKSFVLFKSF